MKRIRRPATRPVRAAQPSGVGALRRRAVARLRQQSKAKSPDRRGPGLDPRKAVVSAPRLVHELQVHQVELEMQNAALQETRNRLELLLEDYTDLYDFAPVGYFSLDPHGHVQQVNLTGAAMLGVERSRLIQRDFSSFVAADTRLVFTAFLRQMFHVAGRRVCEVTLVRSAGGSFWANLHGSSVPSETDTRSGCRVVVSDLTSLKQAEEAQRRLAALSNANRELREEIIRRQEVEKALKSSELHQIELLKRSRHLQEQLRHLSHQILQAQEDERKRISRELHDQVSQTLVGIHVHLESLARDAITRPADLRRRITSTQHQVEKAVHLVHEFARELRPPLLDDLGLIAGLHSLMKDFGRRTGIRVHLTTFAGVNALNPARCTVLFRVAQSALANVAQHAHASRVKVSLRRFLGVARMEVTDNGRSFDVERVLHARRNQRLGLIGMRERVEMVGGSFVVESSPGHGTTVRAEIPFDPAPMTRSTAR